MSSLREEIQAMRQEVRAELAEVRKDVQALKEDRAWARGVWRALAIVGTLAGAAAGWLLRVWPLGLFLLAGCAEGVPAYRYSWGATAPVDVTIDTSMSEDCRAAAETGLAFWATYTDRLEVRYEALNGREPHFAEITVTAVDVAEHEAGHTEWWHVDGRMLRAHIMLDPDWCAAAPFNAPHEFGHALGLPHTAVRTNVMYGRYPEGLDVSPEDAAWVSFWR